MAMSQTQSLSASPPHRLVQKDVGHSNKHAPARKHSTDQHGNTDHLDDTIVVRTPPSKLGHRFPKHSSTKPSTTQSVDHRSQLGTYQPSLDPERQRNVRLRMIKFLEGAEELRNFPDHLIAAMKENCRLDNASQPTCIRKGLGKIACNRPVGEKDEFRVKSTNEKLLIARYTYGSLRLGNMQYLTVAREPSGKTIHNGQVFIIVGARGGITPNLLEPASRGVSGSYWHVWNSKRDVTRRPKDQAEVIRYFKVENAPADKHRTVSCPEDSSISQTHLLDRAESISDNAAGPSSLFQLTQHRNQDIPAGKPKRDIDHVLLGDSSDSDVPLSQQRKKSRPAEFTLPESPAAPLTMTLEPQNLQRRNSLVQLGCIDIVSSTKNRRSKDRIGSAKVSVPQTPSTSSPVPSYESEEAGQNILFAFRKASQSKILRSRSYKHCKSVQMLFAQAWAAGLIKTNDMMLLLSSDTADGRLTARVVRDDPADFELFIHSVKNTLSASTEISVSLEDD